MPKSTESINRELDELLGGLGFDTVALDSSGEKLPTPDDADVLQFHFHKDKEEFGPVTVSIDGLQRMIVYYDDRVADSPQGEEQGEISWFSLVKKLKRFAMSHQLGFDLRDSDRLRKDMRLRSADQKEDERGRLMEGYWGSGKVSYSDPNPQIKLIIKHNRVLEQDDPRYRYIDRIFLENELGERVLVPTVKPSQARMFARHLAEGGQYRDDRWAHMVEICEDIQALGGFMRATRNRAHMFTESASDMIAEAAQKYGSLRETVRQLGGSRGYNRYFENYRPTVMESDSDHDVASVFTNNRIDPRIEAALPVLAKFNITRRQPPQAELLEQWADSVLNEILDPLQPHKIEELEELLADPDFELGPDALNAIGALDDILENDDLYDELRVAAQVDPNTQVKPLIISWMSRQDNPAYRDIVRKFEDEQGEQTDDTSPPPEPEKPQSIKPTAAVPKAPPQAAPAQPAPGGLPPLPDLGSLPPLAEDDLQLTRLRQLIGR